jgi:hypothetical protein
MRWLVLDVDRVGHEHPAAGRLLDRLVDGLGRRDVVTVAVDSHHRGLVRDAVTELDTLDEALRWCEDRLLGS